MTGITGLSSLVSAAATSTGTTASTSGTTSGTTATGTARDQMGKDTFLKLMVAQLKYQNPESPADATQFLSQTAQFTLVEKIDALSTLDQKVLDSSKAQAAMTLVGRKVSWNDVSGTSHTGTVTAATLGSQTPNLTVDGQTVSLDDVTGTLS